MAYYLSFDGGGTKLKSIVFDENLNLVASASSGGVNTNFYKPDDVIKHIRESIGSAASSVGGDIKAAYGVMVGGHALISEEISKILPRADVKYFGEAHFALWSALFKLRGICAISGTGASFIWLDDDNGRYASLAGLGSYIGDEGSGYYIGEHGIRAAMQYMNGWGKPTVLTELYYEMTGGADPFEYFYGEKFSHIPFHMKISKFTYQVGKACGLNDEVAVSIVSDAAEKLAVQTAALIERYDIPRDTPIVMCGGAWNTDERMKTVYADIMGRLYPDMKMISPILEPAVGGVVCHAAERDMLNESTKKIIINNFKEL